MIYTIKNRHISKIERIHTLKTPDIKAILVRVGAALVVCMNAADRTKVMPGEMSIELVERKDILTLDHSEAIQGYRATDIAFAAADRTIAAAGVFNAVGQMEFEYHSTTVTTGPVSFFYFGFTYFFHCCFFHHRFSRRAV